MAGSYRHLVDGDNKLIGEDYPFIECMHDATACIDELFAMVQYLSGGNKAKIFEAYREGYFKPNCPPENLPQVTYERFWHD
jgi:hypothetical protein